MPIGIIFNCIAVALGGILGSVAGNCLQEDFKEKMNWIFGCCAMTMGISSIVLMVNMPAVILSVVVGTMIGLAVHLGELIEGGIFRIQAFISKESTDAEYAAQILTVSVLFCASGTGIYGSMVSGMNGDHSILIAKAILDLFTAMIFSCTLGKMVSLIAIPQFVVMMIIFALGRVIGPHISEAMVGDFKAVGGVLLLATGFRMIRIRMFPTADMIPAMILAMPVSYLWMTLIAPLL